MACNARYDVIEMKLAPNDLGWPARRPRRWTALVHRRWVCHATSDEFAERFCASAQMLGSDLFAFGSADDPTVQKDYREVLLKKLGARLEH